jgi:RNA polymerase sigma-70 factor (ECF subfamily)
MYSQVVDWLAEHFIPFETDLRGMLRRVCASPAEVDDVIQETCYKILQLDSVEHVLEPRAYLVRTAKNIVNDRLRKDAIVSFEALASLETLELEDHQPTAERIVQGRTELSQVLRLIEALPERCRKVFRARRLQGLPRQEVAEALGISVGIVEYEITRAMDLISAGLRQGGAAAAPKDQPGQPLYNEK